MSKQEIYVKYMRILVQLIRDSYDRKGLRASGKFERSLEIFEEGSVIGVKGAKHATQMEFGRGAGAWSNIDALKQWIEDKVGLPQSMKDNKDRVAFLIARKHFMQGLKVPNEHNEGGVISEPIKVFEENYLEDMFNELGDFYLLEMRRTFRTAFAA